jgi:hypothetical protein
MFVERVTFPHLPKIVFSADDRFGLHLPTCRSVQTHNLHNSGANPERNEQLLVKIVAG